MEGQFSGQREALQHTRPVSKRGKKIQFCDDMSHLGRITLCISELCGTAILVFLGCAGCVMFDGPLNHLQVCLTFGLAAMAAVQCVNHISGSHINPVATVAAATLGNIPLVQVPIYFAGQMLGALVGFGFLQVVTPEEYLAKDSGLCSQGLRAELTPLQGLFVEFLLSALFTLVCCGIWDCRNKKKHDSAPIRLGLSITALALAGGPYTGAHMNPARSFAPALINGKWEYHWIYWVGPLSAGFVGALFYRVLFGKEEEENGQTKEQII